MNDDGDNDYLSLVSLPFHHHHHHLFVHKNNFIKTRQPTTSERDRQG